MLKAGLSMSAMTARLNCDRSAFVMTLLVSVSVALAAPVCVAASPLDAPQPNSTAGPPASASQPVYSSAQPAYPSPQSSQGAYPQQVAPGQVTHVPIRMVSVRPQPEERMRNVLYGGLFGAGIAYSLNYERLLFPELGIRIGVGYYPDLATETTTLGSTTETRSADLLAIPISVSYLGIGTAASIFELGGGLTALTLVGDASAGFGDGSASGTTVLGTLHAGWRYHPVRQSGFMFRIGLMALVGDFAGGIFPWLYLSGGLAF